VSPFDLDPTALFFLEPRDPPPLNPNSPPLDRINQSLCLDDFFVSFMLVVTSPPSDSIVFSLGSRCSFLKKALFCCAFSCSSPSFLSFPHYSLPCFPVIFPFSPCARVVFSFNQPVLHLLVFFSPWNTPNVPEAKSHWLFPPPLAANSQVHLFFPSPSRSSFMFWFFSGPLLDSIRIPAITYF